MYGFARESRGLSTSLRATYCKDLLGGDCGHTFCRQCWRGHLKALIDTNQNVRRDNLTHRYCFIFLVLRFLSYSSLCLVLQRAATFCWTSTQSLACWAMTKICCIVTAGLSATLSLRCANHLLSFRPFTAFPDPQSNRRLAWCPAPGCQNAIEVAIPLPLPISRPTSTLINLNMLNRSSTLRPRSCSVAAALPSASHATLKLTQLSRAFEYCNNFFDFTA